MNPENFAGHPLRVLFIFLGLFSLLLMQGSRIALGYLPRRHANSLSVQVDYRGVFEAEVERTLTVPLENAMAGISGIEEIFSISERERCRIYLRFSDETDTDEAYLDVRETVNGLLPDLPEAVQRPVIARSDPRDRPVFAAVFDRTRIPPEEIKRRFEAVPGAGEVETSGTGKREIILRADPDQVPRSGFSLARIPAILRGANVSGVFGPPGGPVLTLDHRISSPDAITAVRLGPSLTVGNLAAAEFSEAGRDSETRLDGREHPVIYVRPAGDANILRLSAGLNALAASIPGCRILFDLGGSIRGALAELLRSVAAGVSIVIFLTVFFFRKPVLACILCINIPFSVFAALGVLRAAGFELDIMVLSGFAVGSGLVIDGGILVGEAYISCGGSLKDSFRKARDPVLYSSLTSAAVFLPLLFASRNLTDIFGGFALALAAQIGASLIYVFLFLPSFLHAAYRFRPFMRTEESPAFLFFRRAGLTDRAPGWVGRASAAALCLLLAAGFWFFKPDIDLDDTSREFGGNLSFIMEYESGTTLERVISVSEPLENKLKAFPGIRSVRVKYERERAAFDIVPEASGNRDRIEREIRKEAADLPEGFPYFPELRRDEESFRVVISGPDNRTLRQIAVDLSERFRTFPEVRGIVFHFKEALPSFRIVMDPAESSRLGIAPANAAEILHWAMSAPVADKIVLSGEETDLRLSVPPGRTETRTKLLDFRVPGRDGGPVRMGDFSRMEERPETGRIYRTNRRRSLEFSVRTAGGNSVTLIPKIRDLSRLLPDDFLIDAAPEKYRKTLIGREILAVLVLATVLLTIILVFLFEEIRIPLVIVIQIPPCLSAALLVLRICDMPLDMPAALGLILTGGIVVNNSLLVYRRKEPGSIPSETLFFLPRDSLRPMAMATLTTIGGILPLLLATGAAGGDRGILASISVVIAAGTAASPPVLAAAVAIAGRQPKGTVCRKRLQAGI